MVGGPASAFLSGTDRCVDYAGDVTVGVTSPAVLAGEVAVVMDSPAVAGAESLADFAGDFAVCRCWGLVPGRCWGGVPGRSYWQCCQWSDGLDCTGLGENRGEVVVRNSSVFNDTLCCVSEMDCGDCSSPDVWCQEMPEICDDLNCQYINYVGCDPDCTGGR